MLTLVNGRFDIIRPTGCLFLSEAIDLAGRSQFGADWHGREVFANRISAPENWPVPELDGRLARVLALAEPEWRFAHALSSRLAPEHKAAAFEHCKAEWAARQRFEKVAEKVRAAFDAKEMKPRLFDSTSGNEYPIDREEWVKDGVWSTLEAGNREPVRSSRVGHNRTVLFPNRMKIYRVPPGGWLGVSVEGRAIIEEAELRRWLSGEMINRQAFPNAEKAEALEPSCEDDIDDDHTGFPGKPTLKNAILAEFKRRAATGDVAESLAEEARQLQEWAEEKYGPRGKATPTARTIETQIRSAYRRHQAQLQ